MSVYTSEAAVLKDVAHLDLLIQRLKAEEMPPKKAKSRPTAEERREVVAWFADLRDREMKRNAGDPGVVLARRLSNAEYNYTIRDLTGVDIKPTREFPVDPANTAGFDNSGETLVMSPALLNKYLKAAHEVASHMFLKPEGFASRRIRCSWKPITTNTASRASSISITGKTSITPTIFKRLGAASIGRPWASRKHRSRTSPPTTK